MSQKSRWVRIFAVIIIAASVCSTAGFVIFHHEPEKTLTVTVTDEGRYGSLLLDISMDDLRSIGADYGYDLNFTYKGIQKVCFLAKDWNGVPSCSLFLNHSPSRNEVVISIYSGDIKMELGMKMGDTFTLSVKCVNKYYPLIPHYLAGYSLDRNDYDTDEEYGNYREVTTSGIMSGLFYRSSSPFSTTDERHLYVDEFLSKKEVKNLIALDLSDEEAAEFADAHPDMYASSLYEKGKVFAFVASPAVFSYPDEIVQVLDRIMDNDGSTGIFCECGKDRTGVYAAIIEGLAGASYEEIRADFLLSQCNMYFIEEGSDEYEAVGEMYIDRILYIFEHPEVINHFTDIDWDNIVIEHYNPEDVFTDFLIDVVDLDQTYVDALKEKIKA